MKGFLQAMEETRVEDKTFELTDFSKRRFASVGYEKCKFVHCDLSDADLSNTRFSACEFTGCNLSNARTAKTVLRGVTFKECKLIGVHFDQCHGFLLSMDFENCSMDFCTFGKLNLRKTKFIGSRLHDADFTGADLTSALFDRCDLSRTTFDGSVLEKADFRTSYNYAIDPERNRLKKAKFSLAGVAGLLGKYNIEIE